MKHDGPNQRRSRRLRHRDDCAAICRISTLADYAVRIAPELRGRRNRGSITGSQTAAAPYVKEIVANLWPDIPKHSQDFNSDLLMPSGKGLQLLDHIEHDGDAASLVA